MISPEVPDYNELFYLGCYKYFIKTNQQPI
jgi:hypothetical protein